jgi:hypothetical protein
MSLFPLTQVDVEKLQRKGITDIDGYMYDDERKSYRVPDETPDTSNRLYSALMTPVAEEGRRVTSTAGRLATELSRFMPGALPQAAILGKIQQGLSEDLEKRFYPAQKKGDFAEKALNFAGGVGAGVAPYLVPGGPVVGPMMSGLSSVGDLDEKSRGTAPLAAQATQGAISTALGALPVGMINKVIPPGASRGLRAAISAPAFAAPAVADTVSRNVTAGMTYNPNQNLLENIPSSALVGAGMGGVYGASTKPNVGHSTAPPLLGSLEGIKEPNIPMAEREARLAKFNESTGQRVTIGDIINQLPVTERYAPDVIDFITTGDLAKVKASNVAKANPAIAAMLKLRESGYEIPPDKFEEFLNNPSAMKELTMGTQAPKVGENVTAAAEKIIQDKAQAELDAKTQKLAQSSAAERDSLNYLKTAFSIPDEYSGTLADAENYIKTKVAGKMAETKRLTGEEAPPVEDVGQRPPIDRAADTVLAERETGLVQPTQQKLQLSGETVGEAPSDLQAQVNATVNGDKPATLLTAPGDKAKVGNVIVEQTPAGTIVKGKQVKEVGPKELGQTGEPKSAATDTIVSGRDKEGNMLVEQATANPAETAAKLKENVPSVVETTVSTPQDVILQRHIAKVLDESKGDVSAMERIIRETIPKELQGPVNDGIQMELFNRALSKPKAKAYSVEVPAPFNGGLSVAEQAQAQADLQKEMGGSTAGSVKVPKAPKAPKAKPGEPYFSKTPQGKFKIFNKEGTLIDFADTAEQAQSRVDYLKKKVEKTSEALPAASSEVKTGNTLSAPEYGNFPDSFTDADIAKVNAERATQGLGPLIRIAKDQQEAFKAAERAVDVGRNREYKPAVIDDQGKVHVGTGHANLSDQLAVQGRTVKQRGFATQDGKFHSLMDVARLEMAKKPKGLSVKLKPNSEAGYITLPKPVQDFAEKWGAKAHNIYKAARPAIRQLAEQGKQGGTYAAEKLSKALESGDLIANQRMAQVNDLFRDEPIDRIMKVTRAADEERIQGFHSTKLTPEEQTLLKNVQNLYTAWGLEERVQGPWINRKGKFSPKELEDKYVSSSIRGEIANRLAKGGDTKLKDEFTKVMNAQGASKEWQAQEWDRITSPHKTAEGDVNYGPLREPEGYHLPPDWQVNLPRRMMRYAQKSGADLAWYKEVETDPKMAEILGEYDNGRGGQHPKPTVDITDPSVRALARRVKLELDSKISPDRSQKLQALNGIFNKGAVQLRQTSRDLMLGGPLIAAHSGIGNTLKGAANVLKEYSNLKNEGLVRNPSSAKIDLIRLKESGFNDFLASANSAMDIMQRSTGTDALNRLINAWSALSGKYAAKEALAKGDDAFFKKHGLSDWRSLNPTEVETRIAKRVQENVVGAYNSKDLPEAFTERGALSSIAPIMRWSVSQFNNQIDHVFKPALKGNFKPLLILALGGMATNEMVDELNKTIFNSKPNDLTFEEWMNAGKPKEWEYILGRLAQANVGGVLSQMGSMVAPAGQRSYAPRNIAMAFFPKALTLFQQFAQSPNKVESLPTLFDNLAQAYSSLWRDIRRERDTTGAREAQMWKAYEKPPTVSGPALAANPFDENRKFNKASDQADALAIAKGIYERQQKDPTIATPEPKKPYEDDVKFWIWAGKTFGQDRALELFKQAKSNVPLYMYKKLLSQALSQGKAPNPKIEIGVGDEIKLRR